MTRAATIAFGLALWWIATPALAQDTERGRELYDRWCAECHGTDGAGEGSAAAYMMPRPRDFTTGLYQIRTTANGELPTDADLVRVIEDGMPGTAMPGWESKFSDDEVRDLVAYIKDFSDFFELFGAPEPLEFGDRPGADAEALAEGRRLYEQIECWKCHGDRGRGDGPSAPTLQDDLDFPIRAADLSENWNFNGGGRVQDIYRRLRTGMDGTPMPSFSDLIDSGFMTDEQMWYLAAYVRSLSPPERPRVRDVIAARRVEGRVPAAADDSAWNAVPPYYVPLVGQIIEQPRWFAPGVDGLYIRALHDGATLALRVTWHDPSQSPDPDWLEWQGWVAETVQPAPEAEPTALLPDRLVVQFPTAIPTGRERPYFLMGDSRRPVYLWEWSSDAGAHEAWASGLGTRAPLDGGDLSAAAEWEAGAWTVVFQRPLAAADTATTLSFRSGVAIPIAFFAWDGSNGESGAQMAVSSWYSIYLEEPTPKTVYVSPVLAMLVTAGLGVLVVWRAQRREVEGSSQQ
ncbi:MAG: c-type cytochrome [Gemmatimonadetes bacterium]|uniref:C-type cytochrome n=1 Tax=Candidatus Kutchimonas denitrificans TaxID=3056748 RepID=A0AAE5CAA0_9BACT|nr:c-type cytochrome [Gemmatimonadota bacterium]NIR76261.1 c-type cytochrome [Candidatus Kutchimonas denitrificans]NIS02284.1 c-type cytochrome [Gemmatimonadota bacterium]NIT68103.1 c-type cytochrome [Gemmatimonadota bacterium]NIU54327.1 c-type cytochrome [Gemmatimonadota bacterium]